MSRHDRASFAAATTHAGSPLPVVIDTRRRGVRAVSRFIADSLLVLPVGCLAALLWTNTHPESYFRFADALDFPVNEIGIVFVLALVTKQVVEATLPGGALHPWRRATLPVAAAMGGAIVPVALYVLILRFVGEPMLRNAWLVTSAADIAVCYLIGGWIFGKHPAIPFLLLLAIASNAIGLVSLAALYPIAPAHFTWGIGLMAVAIGGAFGLRRLGVHSFWPYVLGCGTLSWCALWLGGLHPALALVPIVPFLPHARRDPGLFVEPPPLVHDALSEFERWWRGPVQGILFLFGLVNAGVPLHGHESGLWALPIATIIGRPIGVLMGTEIAVLAGLHTPHRVGWRELLVIGCASSVGLVMALFFASAALPVGPLLLQMRMGALVGISGAAVALVVARGLHVGRFAR